MQADCSVISLSPSFNSYSNTKLADIAARVVDELVSDDFCDEFYFDREDENSNYAERESGNREEDDEFEFAFVTRDSDLSSADQIFQNGQIRTVYPVFNRDVFLAGMVFQNGNQKNQNDVVAEKRSTIRLPLRKLFSEERETAMTMATTTSSSSSSEVDELDGVPAETYCVWRPKEEEEERCKKSSSTGSSSKRWKFKHLLNRSQSDGGKGNFVFLSRSDSGRRKEKDEKVKASPMGGGDVRSAAAAPPLPPRCNRDGGDKWMSYLPYDRGFRGSFL